MRSSDQRWGFSVHGAIVVAWNLSLVACGSPPPNQALTEQENAAVLEWLTCDECTDGELQFVVDTLGDRAAATLRGALVDPRTYLDSAEIALGAAWTRRDAPGVDSATYVTVFLDNFKASLQRRAAIALAGLGRTDILEDAYDDRGLIGFRADVEAVVADALAEAGAGGPGFVAPIPTSVIVRPSVLEVEVGSAATVEVLVLDAGGRMLARDVTWSSSAPATADIGSSSVGRGRITGESVGTAVLTATAGSASGQTTVTVVGPSGPPGTVRIMSGNGQTQTVGEALARPLRVEVLDGTGTELSGVTVTFRVARGDALPVNASTTTDASGQADLYLTLGATPGLIWVDAIASDLPPGAWPRRMVRFQVRAVAP